MGRWAELGRLGHPRLPPAPRTPIPCLAPQPCSQNPLVLGQGSRGAPPTLLGTIRSAAPLAIRWDLWERVNQACFALAVEEF